MANNYTYAKGAEYPYQYKYEHMAVTTDCVIFTYEERVLKVLLIRRGLEPFKGEWAFPGGFLRMNETANEGALRELREETALEASAIRELGVFSGVNRDPRERVITIAYYALIKPSMVTGGDDADEAAWFPIDNLPKLAFDHQTIFDAAMEKLRRDIHFEPVGFDLLDDTFTIPDLQRLYEIILGTKFDRRNFQRKVLSSGILEEVPKPEEEEGEICASATHMVLADMCCELDDYQRSAKKRPGRIASQFRLNKAKYEKLKEDESKFDL
ncbi:MAG: NUDIX hydrolase [Bacteroidales bacterium]|nr:NUDIX hydrolase [Bacteroidales bacterium]